MKLSINFKKVKQLFVPLPAVNINIHIRRSFVMFFIFQLSTNGKIFLDDDLLFGRATADNPEVNLFDDHPIQSPKVSVVFISYVYDNNEQPVRSNWTLQCNSSKFFKETIC